MAAFDDLNATAFVRRATAGDVDAFRTLFDALAAPLATFVERLGVAPQDAEEVAADALVKVHRAIGTYRSDRGAKLTTWIFEIARRCAIDHHRSQKRQALDDRELEREHRHGLALKAADTTMGSSPGAAEIAAALEALTENDRDVLRMRQVMEYSEIAEVEQTSEQTIRVRYKRALDRLKQNVELRRSHGQRQART